MSKTLLLTGGCGYIGSHTAVQLLNKGYNVISVDNFSNSTPEVLNRIRTLTDQQLQNFDIDITNYSALRKWTQRIVNDYKIDGIIHFAAYKAVGESEQFPHKYYLNNLQGTNNIAQLATEFDIPNIIFSSSCTVYGQPADDDMPVTENTPLKPASSVYGHTKQISEEIFKHYTRLKNLRVLALRYFNPVGAHPSGKLGELPLNPPQALLPVINEVAFGKREKLVIFGNDYPTRDGTCLRDYIHIMDLADAHIKAFEYLETKTQKRLFEPINIGSGDGVTVQEMILAYEKYNNIKLNYEYGPRRKGDVAKIYANTTTAQKKLHWQPTHTLKDMVTSAYLWGEEIFNHPSPPIQQHYSQ